MEFKAKLNRQRRGLLPELDKAFPNIIPVARPIIQLPVNLDINWFIGLLRIDGVGSFFVNITGQRPGKTKIGYLVQINFNLTQHIRDAGLFKFIQGWLGCGLIYEIHKESRVNLVITNLQDIINILIPKLNQYPRLPFYSYLNNNKNKKSLARGRRQGIKRLKFTARPKGGLACWSLKDPSP